MNIQLTMTSNAVPEQYDAYLDGKVVGYLRLRHGVFRVQIPTVGGDLMLFETFPDEWKGQFADDYERAHYLKMAKAAIRWGLGQKPQEGEKIWPLMGGKNVKQWISSWRTRWSA